MLTRFFALTENRTTVRTEVLAGLTTFLTMAYIIFVQPAVLSGAMLNEAASRRRGRGSCGFALRTLSVWFCIGL